jgi:uncharacterized protein
MHTSRYTTQIPLSDSSDVLLMHGYSGAFDRVPASVAAYLRALAPPRTRPLHGEWTPEPAPHAVTPPPDALVDQLRRRGYLTDKSADEERAIVRKLAAALHEADKQPAYVLMTTYDCNLRCPYCFQDELRTDPNKRALLKRMTPALVDRIFAAFPGIEARHGIDPAAPPRPQFMLFGGESLLAENRPLVTYILERAKRAGADSLAAISNATELDAYADLLGPGNISFLQITLDGVPEEHDRRRIYADGSGSFDKIARNIDMALARGVRIDVRLNLDRRNLGDLPRLAEIMRGRGWDQAPTFTAYGAAIFAGNEAVERAHLMDNGQLSRALEELHASVPATRIIGRPSDALKTTLGKVFAEKGDPLQSFRASYCGAHTTMYVFDPLGDIYACWERTGNAKARVGWVDEAGNAIFPAPAAPPPRSDGKRGLPVVQKEPSDLQTWRARTVSTNPTCLDCRYAFYCGGGCAVRAWEDSGGYYSNYCDGFQAQFRAAAVEAYADHVAGVRVVDSPASFCSA